jgi:co-chaperonin GroES (HSP10)
MAQELDTLPKSVFPGFVMVRPDEKKEKTDSGIIIAVEATGPVLTGTVLLAGNTKTVKTFSQVGDRVLYNNSLVGEIEVDRQKYLIMREDGNVRAIL